MDSGLRKGITAGQLAAIMESHQVIRAALEKVHVKEVAEKMGISLSLLYKWGEESGKNGGNYNPLDRVRDLFEHTQDEHLVQIAAISHAASDNFISREEAGHIRHEWEEIKSLTERFVKWCEQEDFVHLAEDLKVNRVGKA